jgi:hypothetical protein
MRPVSEWNAAGLCTNCGGERDDALLHRCKRCREMTNASHKRRRLKGNLCSRCALRPPAEGFKQCVECRANVDAYWKARGGRRRSAVTKIADTAARFVAASRAAAHPLPPKKHVEARERVGALLRELFRAVARGRENAA